MLIDWAAAAVGGLYLVVAQAAVADAALDSPYRVPTKRLQEFRLRDDASYRLPPKSAPVSARSAPLAGQARMAAELSEKPFAKEIETAARDASLDPALLHALIHVESRHRQQVVSSKGALGLMQVLPDTAARYGIRRADRSPQANLRAGTNYLRDLIMLFGDDHLELALAAYNAGEGAVQRHDFRIPPYPETRKYVHDVLAKYEEWRVTETVSVPITSTDNTPLYTEYLPGTRLVVPTISR